MGSDSSENEGGSVTVSIPLSLFNRISEIVKGRRFPSVSEYVTYVLREFLEREEESGSEVFSEEEAERIKRRLRSLGYIE